MPATAVPMFTPQLNRAYAALPPAAVHRVGEQRERGGPDGGSGGAEQQRGGGQRPEPRGQEQGALGDGGADEPDQHGRAAADPVGEQPAEGRAEQVAVLSAPSTKEMSESGDVPVGEEEHQEGRDQVAEPVDDRTGEEGPDRGRQTAKGGEA